MKNAKTLLFAIAFTLTAPALANAAAPSACETFSTTMTTRILNIFHNTKETPVEKRTDLTKLFQQAVDTNWIGKFALGPYWRTAPQQERQPYLSTFRDYLTYIYVSKFHDDDAEKIKNIKVLSVVPQSGDRIYVKSLIERQGDGKNSGENTQVDYILKQSSHQCQVHDIKIAGVSLLVTLRSEFSALAGSAGIKGVIKQMRNRLASD